MEIRKKITFQFSAVVAILLLVSLVVVYLLFASFRKDEFRGRLSGKAESLAGIIAGSGNPEQLQTEGTRLPQQGLVAFNEKDSILYSSGTMENCDLPAERIENIRAGGKTYFHEDSSECVGYYYEYEGGSLVVLCSANDVFGYRKLDHLKIILIGVFFLSLALFILIGRMLASRALMPISDMVKQVNDIDIQTIGKRVLAGSGEDELALLADTFNRMLERLDSAFKTQEDFIANISHELRTPLTSITGQIEVTLLKERTNEEYRQALSSALDDIRNLNNLTNRLLTLLRAGTALSDKSFGEIRIDEVLWKARSEYLKLNKNHKVEIYFDESIKDEHHFRLRGNPELLKTAFVNLIDNGCKYSPAGRVEIRLAIRDDFLTVNFIDEGIGIPENEIGNIIRPFYRASNAKKDKGHGIGLSLVDSIVHMHNGRMQIESVLHKGTTISLFFSLSDSF